MATKQLEIRVTDIVVQIFWNGDDDKDHPLNWKPSHKWRAVIVVSSAVFSTSIASAMVTPNVPAIAETLSIDSKERMQLIYSVFALSYAVGPLIFCPISEQLGRYWTITTAMVLFSLGNLVCGLSRSATLLIAARFFSGMGGNGGQSVAIAVLSDTFSSDDRMKAISVYSTFSISGMVIGPILGAICSEKFHWRTLFHGTSVLNGIALVIVATFLPETYPPTLLRREATKISKIRGGRPPRTQYDVEDSEDLRRTMWHCARRSVKFLVTQPILQFIAVYYGLGFGVSFIIFSVFPSIWTEAYGQTPIKGSLNFIWLGVGCLIPGASIVSAIESELALSRIESERRHILKPEKVFGYMFPAAVFLPLGLFLFGYSVQNKWHPAYVNIGAAFVGFASTIISFAIFKYLGDAYPLYEASAIAAVQVSRAVTSCTFPVFSRKLFAMMGYDGGTGLLASIALVLGLVGTSVLVVFGKRLRQKTWRIPLPWTKG
ncbi:MFS general substrate transporter [Eremomyces bilateralis CBS 781.70]|uniref:MFS general substrate transporter n=1 Tax=Eremomyces bilateralis CBS 781.70 TaxID=1392243 RepID=A0A6G1FW18_9PEZI|nr:MFS general substrate transporter [Eremomyces bilateralis CBS 781.70]KAF1809871.1 MFS general substrate transporter [Eremomyces bilateralis CBS 781.70]